MFGYSKLFTSMVVCSALCLLAAVMAFVYALHMAVYHNLETWEIIAFVIGIYGIPSALAAGMVVPLFTCWIAILSYYTAMYLFSPKYRKENG